MKCLTICQPYASAIFLETNPKDAENRTWRTNYRGPLAILAGLSRKGISDAWDEMIDGGDSYGRFAPLAPFDELPFGQIIGVVELVDVQPMSPELELNPWATGPYCWVLRRPMKLKEPMPYSGQQGLFNLTDETWEKMMSDFTMQHMKRELHEMM